MKKVEVVCAVIRHKDKYFCCKRGPSKSLAYKWEFPGGKIEKDESKEDALIREIKEELSSEIKIINYLDTIKHEYLDLANPFEIIMHAYLCDLVKGNLELTEHIESGYFSIQEMFKMDFADADKPIIKLLEMRI